jgi:non-ribosomal peptide synthetase component F
LSKNLNKSEDGEGKVKRVEIGKSSVDRIDAYCRKNKITRFVFLMTAFKATILEEVAHKNISIGIPVAGRNHSDLHNMMGVFLNVLVISTSVHENTTYKEYMSIVDEAVKQAQDNQDYPYEELYEEIKKRQGHNENALFSIMFNYLPYDNNAETKLEGLEVDTYEFERLEPKYDITLYANEYSERIELKVLYKSNLYEVFVMDRIFNNMVITVSDILEDDNKPVIKIDLSENMDCDDFEQHFDNEELLF